MRLTLIVLSALVLVDNSASADPTNDLAKTLIVLPDVKLDAPTAASLVTAALATDHDPALLLAQAYVESRFDSTATSRLVDGKRHVGAWPSRLAPAGWSATLYCGVAQTAAITWKRCLELRDVNKSINAQADELTAWLRLAKGNLRRALAGYGCGNVGLSTGWCRGYPERVMKWAEAIRSKLPATRATPAI